MYKTTAYKNVAHSSPTIASVDSTAGAEQFRGAFEFNKIVLNWSPDDILRHEYTEQKLTRLPKRFNQTETAAKDRHHYYLSFRPLVLAETWAILKKGLSDSRALKDFSFQLSRSAKFAKNSGNPSTMSVEGVKLAPFDMGSACVALLLTTKNKRSNKSIKLLGIATQNFHNENTLTIKFLYREGMGASVFSADSKCKWQAKPLGGLITQERIYHICSMQPKVTFMDDLLYGELLPWPKPATNFQFSQLNPVQSRIINSFLSAEEGVFLLQGPPGTGKTTTITALLDKLVVCGDRTLVCAPSNKAVQLLAKRYYKNNKDTHMVLIGVENKLAPALENIFLENIYHALKTAFATLPHYKSSLAAIERSIKTAADVEKIKQDYQTLRNNCANFPWNLANNVFPDLATNFYTFQVKLPACQNLFPTIPNVDRDALSCLNKMATLFHNAEALPEEFSSFNAIITRVKQRGYRADNLTNVLALKNSFGSLLNEFTQVQANLSWNAYFFAKRTVAGWLGTDYEAIITHVNQLLTELKSALDQFNKTYLSRRMLMTELASLTQQLDIIQRHYAQADLKEAIIDTADIIFSTLSITGRQLLRDGCKVDTLIIDEAGQAVEAETLIPLSLEPARCLLVGDTKQLPATTISTQAEQHLYNRSLLSRLIDDCREPYEMLTIQYRMHEAIRIWPSNRYYQGKLVDGIKVQPIAELQNYNVLGTYSFINVHGQEKMKGYSYYNSAETQAIKSIIQTFTELGLVAKYSIGIITFYAGQVRSLQKNIQDQANITINTVDGFQGSEKDIIIISCVRSNSKNAVGFLNDFRRLNVAITRAKSMLLIIGNADTLKQSNSKDFHKLLNDVDKRGRLFKEKDLQLELQQLATPTITQQIKPKAVVMKKEQADTARSKKHSSINRSCNFFQATGACKYGDQCKFSHTEDVIEEVRPQL